MKITGRTRDPEHLRAHLSYITRNGGLAAEGRDGWSIEGRGEVVEERVSGVHSSILPFERVFESVARWSAWVRTDGTEPMSPALRSTSS